MELYHNSRKNTTIFPEKEKWKKCKIPLYKQANTCYNSLVVRHAPVAQWIEHRIPVPRVGGSSPFRRTKKADTHSGICFFDLLGGRDSKDKIPQSSGLWAAPTGGCRTLQFANGKLHRVPSGRAVPADNAHGNLPQIVTAPPVPGIVTAVQNRDVDNHQQVPPPQQTVSLPPAGSLRHLRCQLPPGGSYGVRTFSHWFVLLGKCLLWNPSVTATPCQLPLAREPLGAVSIPGGSGKQRAAEIYRAH